MKQGDYQALLQTLRCASKNLSDVNGTHGEQSFCLIEASMAQSLIVIAACLLDRSKEDMA